MSPINITVFSSTSCPYCTYLKEYLNEKSFSFSEKILDQDAGAKEEMISDSHGFLGVPFTVIVKDDGTKETVIGFDKNRLNTILGIHS